MNKPLLWTGIVALAGAVGYFAWEMSRPEPVSEPAEVEAAPAPPPVLAEPPAIRYPVEADPQAAALPALDESDAVVGDALAQALGAPTLPGFVYPDRMIRRFVVTIDNLPRSKTPTQMMPVQPVPGAFKVTGPENQRAIAQANAARYQTYVGLMERADVPKLVDFYVRHYPLFQQAYVELGYPKGYFNDRLVEALDHLLAAPEVATPVRLVQPKVMYQFADPDLEALSAGQKIMVRMGSENAARVKSVLRTFRNAVVGRAGLVPADDSSH